MSVDVTPTGGAESEDPDGTRSVGAVDDTCEVLLTVSEKEMSPTRRAPIARLETQIPFDYLSLTLRMSLETLFGICVIDLAIGAPLV